ncbi:MAG: histidine kinase [Rhodoferax sp.]|nr:histidine kinase [Rhodoferax sp.]
MQLPDKVQTAAQVLQQFDMRPERVAPFHTDSSCAFARGTPPPLWGASTGYWDFHAWLTECPGALSVMAVGYMAWREHAADAPGRWTLAFLWQAVIWTAAGIFGWADACEKRRSAAREAAVLELPSWEHFHAGWRPSLQNLRHRTEPYHYWLRSLWNDALVHRAGAFGLLSFVGVVILSSTKAGSYGEGIAIAYVALTVVGFTRTHRRKPLPAGTFGGEHAVGWRVANGFWIGSVVAATVWEAGVGQLLGYPPGYNTVYFALAAAAIHVSEWISFAQQRDLALRVERAEQNRQLAEVRLQVLKSQIEPHFIFNTLAHLKTLIKTNPLSAEDMADELSDFLRASLKALREERVTVAQEFELVRAYLALAGLRMGQRLHIELELQSEAAKQPIPPLIVHTLVENAIKHGIEPKVGDGSIRVHARIDDSGSSPVLAIQVKDDDVGFGENQSCGTGLGLANIRERLASAYGTAASLTLAANTPAGVIATLRLPVQNQS